MFSHTKGGQAQWSVLQIRHCINIDSVRYMGASISRLIIIILLLLLLLLFNNNNNNTAVTSDLLETDHLFQRLSIAIPQANAVSFTSTFKSE